MNPSISADRPANMTRRLSVLQQCLLCAAVMTAFPGQLAAEETGEPLARCDVQRLQVSNTAMRSAAIVPPGVAPNNGPSANYRRGRSGDWEMVHDVDGDDPRVRLLVATP